MKLKRNKYQCDACGEIIKVKVEGIQKKIRYLGKEIPIGGQIRCDKCNYLVSQRERK